MLPERFSRNSAEAGLRVQDETLISQRSKYCSTCESNDRRKFLYAYNLFEEKGVIPVLKYDAFHFLDPQKLVEPPKNTISIDPLKVGLPRFSTLKGALQCIHWREAEAAGWELVEEVIATRGAGAVIPEELKTDKRRKMLEMVETAVIITIHHYAVSDAPRIRILTKAILFLFLHDDVIESVVNTEGGTVLEGWDNDTFTADELDHASRNDVFLGFCREAIAVDPILGLELMQDTVRWARYSRNHNTKDIAHVTWNDFYSFREIDIADDFMITAVRFAANTLHEKADRSALHDFERLYIRHCVFINDLHSHDSEAFKAQSEGAPPHNSIHTIEQIFSVPSSSAKGILRSLLWDCERQMREEYQRLISLPDINERQKEYLKRVVECIAGNMVYSMTTYRYAQLSGKILERPDSKSMQEELV
ncbi:terpenoid synthase [Penicillium malachiteum]|uniref:Terpenoid synthase n=1 Tax=Penicillium malachiteum TaxID=1324776 RepID=A0AAD6HDQ7_9EURO|nr:terpenoid synthase [Penicillium malachiteum]